MLNIVNDIVQLFKSCSEELFDLDTILVQCCGSVTIFFGSGSGSHFPPSFGSGSEKIVTGTDPEIGCPKKYDNMRAQHFPVLLGPLSKNIPIKTFSDKDFSKM